MVPFRLVTLLAGQHEVLNVARAAFREGMEVVNGSGALVEPAATVEAFGALLEELEPDAL